MKHKFAKWSRKRKKILKERLKHDETDIRFTPVFSASNIRLDFSEKISAIGCGGIGAVHTLVKRSGLDKRIDQTLHLLKIHKPYQESDHVLNIAYNIVCGGRCLDDIETRRNDAAYMDALGADRIPDPTTAGDFLRRFGYDDVVGLMDLQNEFSKLIWSLDPKNKQERDAIIDVDGTIEETYGEFKERMDMSYKGIWGFSPLIITESTTGTHLYIVNRSGNAVSHEGAAPWIDRAIEQVRDHFKRTYLRGDSDFALTANFDKWDKAGIGFCFARDSTENLTKMADNLPKKGWDLMLRQDREIETEPRTRKKVNVKKKAIIKRKYKHMERLREYVAEFRYRPDKCDKEYRVVVVKRIVRITKGQLRLMDDVRYFFYITNIEDKTPRELVHFYNKRCNHENKIEQLSNGVHALKMPAAEFNANWAYMAIGVLAWNLKSWIGQIMPDRERGEQVIRMEFKRFMDCMVNIPCQIIKTSRTIVYRILNWTPWIDTFWETFHYIKGLRFVPG